MELVSSPTFPDQHTAAQRVFDTVDVLDLILDHFDPYRDRSSLARLARTRTACFRPSISRLWKRLDSFRPLIALLPKHVLEPCLQSYSTTANEDKTLRTRPMRDDDVLRWQIYSSFVRSIALMHCLLSETVTALHDHGRIDVEDRKFAVLEAIISINSLLGSKALPNLNDLLLGSLTAKICHLALALTTPWLISISIDLNAIEDDIALFHYLGPIVSGKQIKKVEVISNELQNEFIDAFVTVLEQQMEQLESFSLRSALGESLKLLSDLNNLPLLNELAISDTWNTICYLPQADECDVFVSQRIREIFGTGAFHHLTEITLDSSPSFCSTLLDIIQGRLCRLTIQTSLTSLDQFRTLVVSIVNSETQTCRDLKHLSLTFQTSRCALAVGSCWSVLCRLQPLDLHSFHLEGTFYNTSTEDQRITEKELSYLTSEWHNLRHLYIETIHGNEFGLHLMQKIIR
ncbi:hypothetical protein CALVIDRAFT_147116 [Calocera viscosa TUFC12733]|uniref:F-box domain-containing protein n=1 Tax=Calocera viscosa (strain TUFC12733) TaxID=1330018 RepID=A0A167LUU5_CALVF|nr:hypothetical protein CALVIDRAFT_147116 [Calocera viscosa TUFC12733]